MYSLHRLYRRQLESLGNRRFSDQKQLDIIMHLQKFSDDLIHFDSSEGLFSRWFRFKSRSAQTSRREQDFESGIYLWGGVGVGKTFLLDLLFQHIPIKKKKRAHFHQFMQWTHKALAELGKQKEPLSRLAQNLSSEIRLLYLDEFHVTDIADAMILAQFLEYLFLNKVAVMISSNYAPEALYENGLQRQRFLPAIDLINRSMKVLHLESRDYRMDVLSQKQIYNYPLNQHSQNILSEVFQRLTPGEPLVEGKLKINGRWIQAVFCSETLIWFDFSAICGDSRGVSDYFEIAKRYRIIFISSIPVFEDTDDLARRFIHLIDCLYENHVILVCTASCQPDFLYRKGKLKQEFKRTQSRLFEMQSQEYFFQNQR